MKETVFQQELKNTINKTRFWCIKIPDSIRTMSTRFIPKKPADLIAVIYDKPILIECKMLKKIKRIPVNFFANSKEHKNKIHWSEYHQVKELIRFKKLTGGLAYYAINIRAQRPHRINIMILLEIDDFIKLYTEKNIISKEEVIELVNEGFQGARKFYHDDLFVRIKKDLRDC